jgi:hypothetical protein
MAEPTPGGHLTVSHSLGDITVADLGVFWFVLPINLKDYAKSVTRTLSLVVAKRIVNRNCGDYRFCQLDEL